MKNKLTKNYIYRVLVFFLMAIGVGFTSCLSIKADIGLGAWDAIARSLSYIAPIKIGTIATFLNLFCIAGQIILLRDQFKWINLLQLAVSVLVGTSINYFYYDLFARFNPTNYYFRLAILIGAFIVMSICLSVIVILDVIGLPVEFFCAAIAQTFHLEFGKVRQYYDVVVILIVLVLTLIFKIPLTLREGTLIIALILGPLISFFTPYSEKVLLKFGLID